MRTNRRNRFFGLVFTFIGGVIFTLAAADGARAQTAGTPPTAPGKLPLATPGQTPKPGTVGPDDVVMTVGDTKITEKEFQQITSALPPQVAGAANSMGKRNFAERYASMLALSKEGERLKVDQDEEFRQMLDFQRMMLLAQLTVNQVASKMGAVTNEDVENYYKEHESDFKEAKVRGIYIAFKNPQAEGNSTSNASKKPMLTEEEAKAKAEKLRARIEAGEDFATIAKAESDHATAAKGGDFGFIHRRQFAPEIDTAIFSLQPKQVSEPLKDRFGYYIFQVDEYRVQTLDQVRQAIENGLRQQKLGQMLQQVQSKYPVSYNEAYFGPATPAAGLPGAQPVAPVPPVSGPAK